MESIPWRGATIRRMILVRNGGSPMIAPILSRIGRRDSRSA
ncbi:MAG: hypothetical protein JWR00_3013 [Rubritepida sp.]|nr:hypothetical protein [Rubritepida sp.]